MFSSSIFFNVLKWVYMEEKVKHFTILSNSVLVHAYYICFGDLVRSRSAFQDQSVPSWIFIAKQFK